jgi:predicted DNA-binding transcriptional regulator AlpA
MHFPELQEVILMPSEKNLFLDSVAAMRVMTVEEFCDVNGLSYHTGKRLLKSGAGPKVVQLSKRRVGIRIADALAWQESRVRS